MHEHHLLFELVPPRHPGTSRPAGSDDDFATDPFERAAAEAALLRVRLQQTDHSEEPST